MRGLHNKRLNFTYIFILYGWFIVIYTSRDIFQSSNTLMISSRQRAGLNMINVEDDMVSFSVLVYIFKDSELLNVIAPSRTDPT